MEPDHVAMKNGLGMYDLDKKLNKISMIGFMATGKTKNSILLSQLLNRPAIDSDEMIVEKENKTIPEIFEKHGEPYFRDLEKNTLKQIFEMNGSHIISCGGGIVVNQENRNYLRSQSLVIWLFASPEAIVARLKPGKRPLLEVADPLAKAKELLGQRLHYYAQTADILISTERNLKELTTEKIYDEINKTFGNKW
ncbi:MAG: shikimate kinase [Bacteroidales bacterium]|nr:shikimate kinase [Bacteroidales bacterium]